MNAVTRSGVPPLANGRRLSRGARIAIVVGVIAQVIACVACLGDGASWLALSYRPPATLRQADGLPTLRYVDWGFPFFDRPIWSPDGRWIAVLAGDDPAGAHLEVVSPDGRTRHDLSGWGCAELVDGDYAWLPDGRLSCVGTPGVTYGVVYPKICVGGPPFASCDATPLTPLYTACGSGMLWAPDGSYALLAANDKPLLTIYDIPGEAGCDTGFAVLDARGQRIQFIYPQANVSGPAWRPDSSTLSYILSGIYSADPNATPYLDQLVVSSVTRDRAGELTLGPPRVIVSDVLEGESYAWSPDGRWLAVRLNDAGGDRIALVNAANPAQTLDVTSPDFTDGMANPIWSPDGRTLIVFGVAIGVGFNEDDPYRIDIADYLASKGLPL